MARSTYSSQNVQNTSVRDQFWMFRSGKMARRCGAKRICKSKCTKHSGAEQFLKLQSGKMARRCGAKRVLSGLDQFLKFLSPKMAHHCGAKRICKSKCSKKLRGSDNFLKLRCRKISQSVR